MSKILYLLRHAQTAEKQAGQADIARELTSPGKQHAAQIGKFLHQQGKIPEILLCSTAIRAKSTASLVAGAMRFDARSIQFMDELYDLSVDEFKQLVSSIDDSVSSVMIIGHNPILSYLVVSLTGENFQGMHPCGLSIIEFNVENWASVIEGNGTLIAYIDPNNIQP